MSDADAKIAAGTHVLMPVKADGEMMQAIEAWFASRLRYRDRRNDSAMNAECWNALMAYGAMVDSVLERGAPQDETKR